MHKSETLTSFKPGKDRWHDFFFKFPDIEFLPMYARRRMYIIIGSHFVPLEGNSLLISLAIVRITLNVIVWQMSAKQRCVKNFKYFENVFATGGNNIVKVFESLTTSFWTMGTPLFSGHLGAFDALSHLMLLSLQ
jgi:hypothetical protein